MEHLSSPIAVNFPVWPAAEPHYTYQLVFDGNNIAPEKEILSTDKPGDVLHVEIPATLLTEGTHAVSYRIYSPSADSENFSESTRIQIDLTAPGDPLLAPILFPDVIQDGLTSDELDALKNILPGKIASYAGMAAGDVVRTTWGAIEGPTATVSANDMGLNRVMVDFSRDFLLQADGLKTAVSYTVTDLAGNVSIPAEPVMIQLRLSEVVPLPLPIIVEAKGGTLDPADTLNGATLRVSAEAKLRVGDIVIARWDGPKASDYKEKIVSAAEAGQSLSLVFTSALVTANDGQAVNVSYSVARVDGVVQTSDVLTLRVVSAAVELPAPRMEGVGADGVVYLSRIPAGGGKVQVYYPDMKTGDSVKVTWKGAEVHETPSQEVWTQLEKAQAQGMMMDLQFSIPRAVIAASVGHPVAVTYNLTRAAISKTSEILALTVHGGGMQLDTSPVTLNGKVYLLPEHPTVLPAFPANTTVQRVPTGGSAPYTYSSSHPGIAQVDSNGLTSVRGNGISKISVTDAVGEILSYEVTVTGVIQCLNIGKGNYKQMQAAAIAKNGHLPAFQELNELYNAYKGRWPMGAGLYWSSSAAKDALVLKWYYIKDLTNGGNFKLAHHNVTVAVALRVLAAG